MVVRIALVMFVAAVVVACGGSDAERQDQPRSESEIAALRQRVAERYNTDPDMVAVYVGMFAGDDVDRGDVLEVMLDLPLLEYPDIGDAAAQASWQLLLEQR